MLQRERSGSRRSTIPININIVFKVFIVIDICGMSRRIFFFDGVLPNEARRTLSLSISTALITTLDVVLN